MEKLKLLFLLLVVFGSVSYAQHKITSEFPALKAAKVVLKGFNGFDTYIIDSTRVSELGTFTMKYSDKDMGMGYLSD